MDNIKQLNNLINKVNNLENDIASIRNLIQNKVKYNDLRTTEISLKDNIHELSKNISIIEEQLTNIKTPDQTKFYLEKAEIDNFRNNFNKLLLLIERVETLYKNLTSYVISQ